MNGMNIGVAINRSSVQHLDPGKSLDWHTHKKEGFVKLKLDNVLLILQMCCIAFKICKCNYRLCDFVTFSISMSIEKFVL